MFNKCLQLLWAVVKLCAPAFVDPDEMGAVVDNIDIMFDRHHLTAQSDYGYSVPALIFESLALAFGSLV